MILLNTLKAGVVALALAGTALAAVPAQAASPTFGFSLNFGNNFGPGNGGIVLHFGDDNYWDVCYTNKQIIQGLNNKGYSKVKIVKESNSSNKVWAIGRKYGDWFQMRVDRCTGKVDQVKQIYPVNNGGNSFNLTFSF
ncbi:MAG: hypothetical protein ABIY37_14720, partial [Devosia sp.]